MIKSNIRKIAPATGIRRKIRIGFVSLGCLLLFAGVISYFELSRLNRTTDELLDSSLRDLDLSQQMLEAVGQQHAALFVRLYTPSADSLHADALFDAGLSGFDAAFARAQAMDIHTNKLEKIETAKAEYDRVLDELSSDSGIDSLFWYNHRYKIAYYSLLLPVKDFMIDSQHTIDRNTAEIQHNAYRAIVPGIITLAIAVLILFVFYVLIDHYYIRPVLNVKRGLDNYLNHRVPYRVQVDGHDEVRELSEHIVTLVAMNRKKENNTPE